MTWRMALLLGMAGGAGMFLGAAPTEKDSSVGVIQPPGLPGVVLWPGETVELNVHVTGPGPVGPPAPAGSWFVEPAEIKSVRIERREGACRYRLFRPPDHAGAEYDESYRSDVSDPNAPGTIKLTGAVWIQEPLVITRDDNAQRERLRLEGELHRSNEKILRLRDRINALEFERDSRADLGSDDSDAWTPMTGEPLGDAGFSLEVWERLIKGAETR